jgi:hypothetical protein
MVSSTGKNASFHNTAKVHRTICAPNEFEVKFHQPIASAWNSAAATG